MSLAHFSVSQIRTAATCPRIHYFDVDDARRNGLASPRSTLVWIQGTQSKVAGGALFHNIVERFNRQAARAPEILSAIERSEGDVELRQSLLRFVNEHCIDLERLATRSIAMRQAFITVMHSFFGELATIVNYARSNRITPRDIVAHLFGDARRRVDVTFHVGNDDAVHVTGTVDYVFYDWRLPGHRIVDYKLTPSVHANRDLFQVCTYALMHHAQHGTQPGVALFYLHPDRQTIDMGWERVFSERAKVYNLIASMVARSRYDEASGQGIKPPGDVTWCASCKWNKQGQCEKRLGPKLEGHRDQRWCELTHNEAPAEPRISSADLTTSEVALDASDATDAELTLLDEQAEQVTLPSEDPSILPVVCGDVVTPYSVSPAPASQDAVPTKAEQRRVASASAELGHGLYVGNVEETGAPVLLDSRVISTHIAVVGAAGSGKTWTAKVIAEEVVAAGIPVIAIDPQGDLVQFLRMRSDENLEEPDRTRLRAYRERVEPRIFTPGSSHGLRLSLSPIRLTCSEDLARIKDVTRRQEEQEAILSAVANNLVSLAQAGGEQDAQRTFLYKLLEAIPRSKHLQLGDVVSAIMTPDAYGLDEPDAIVRKSDRERLSRKLNSFVMGPAKNLFSGGTPLDLDRMLVPNTPGKIPLNVIYLNALVDDAQKHFFLAALAAEIY
ncbi:MAG TPA: helicase HerA-like domain-containing protein, partial [Polyangiaceae bacterium]